ncbi:transketolase/ thiamine diphosphate binding domain protein [Synechococcus sp. BOUM118]|nr:transketolase/ thiamine diphosphate binding domain protein [Synechococcus sp. BOUM118]
MPLSLPNDLIDPSCFHSPIDISGYKPVQLISFLKHMKLIRSVEVFIADKRKDGFIGGPVHLGVGQEAVAVGVSNSLTSSDRVFGAHRSHSHLLALGSSVHKLFAEVLGKDTGHSRGMGGSMHLWDKPNGFYGSVPIVSGTVPLAVGAGLASKLMGSTDIAVAYLGDGAMEEGVVHESLNLARTLNLPVLFVVENNLFSSHMHISLRQPCSSVSRFAEANSIPFSVLDGNDVCAIESVTRRAVSGIRNGNGPSFLEAVTFRWYGHVDWRQDIDVGVNRSLDDLEGWRLRDPIHRLTSSLLSSKILTDQQIESIDLEIVHSINSSWDHALSDPYPAPEALLNRVYCG